MSAITDATATESAATGSLLSEKWITKVIVAVILGEAIWAFVVSLTNSLVLPGLARAMGGNPQSPLYLGKGDFNVPAIFSSIVELCLAGIVAVLLNQWSRSAPARVRMKTVKIGATAARESMPSISPILTPSVSPSSSPSIPSAPLVRGSVVNSVAPAAPPQSIPAPSSTRGTLQTPPPGVPQPISSISQPAAPPKSAAPAKPEKPKKPKEVYLQHRWRADQFHRG
jgi:hypothetical protein